MTDFLRPNAYHEAGHAIVAWAMDVPVHEIAICDDRPGGHTKTVAGGDDQLPLSNLVMLLNAGRQAEAIFGHLRPSWAGDGDRMDTVKLLADHDVSDTAEIERWIELGCEHARYILRRHAHQVDRLAAQLIECRRMSADQFERFMRGYDADHLNDGTNRIRIYGPKSDRSYWLELRQADGQSFVLSVPASESHVLKRFQRLMPDGLVVPDAGDDGTRGMVANEAEGRAEALRRIAACRTARAEELDLGGLELTALDGELLAALCQLGWLRRLFLGLNAEVRGKQQFDWHELAVNRLGDLPASIANLTSLTSLDLGWNNIGDEGAQALSGLVNLTSLDLTRNDIGDEGVQALKGLVNLTSLDLRDNDVGAEGMQALKGLVNLTSLDLANNGIGAEGMQALESLVNLTSLDLTNSRIGAEGMQALKGLVNLTSLDLARNDIGDEGAQALKGLVNLTSLNLANSRIGAKGAQALKGLVNLTSLDLAVNDIGAEGMQALESLANLTSLDLAGNHIGAEVVQALKSLVNLTSLDLSFNRIGDEGAQALKGLVNLTSLDLAYGRIGDEGVQALKGLVNLTSLNLTGNDIGDVSPLASLRNLRSINLSGVHLGRDVPAFWMLPSLQEAILYDASLPGVPVEILSQDRSDNCLDRLRAHLRVESDLR